MMRLFGRPVLVAALVAGAGVVSRVDAQCTAASPGRFAPPNGASAYGPSGKFRAGFSTQMDLFTYQGVKKLLMTENFGYTFYDLTNPAAPSSPTFCDIESSYHKSGDGFSTVFSVGAAPDGTRVSVGYLEPHGNLLMGRGVAGAPGCTFNFAGEYAPARGRGEVIAAPGNGRYLGFSMAAAGSIGLYVADDTTLLSGTAAQRPNSIAAEPIPTTPAGAGGSLVIAGSWVVYHGVTAVVVVDFGAAGPPGSIVSGLSTKVLTAAQLGFGTDQISSVAAAVHPSTGQLMLLVELSTSAQVPDGFALFSFSGGTATQVGSVYRPTWPPAGTGGTSPGVSTAVPTGNDVYFFAWAHQGSPSANKLFTFSANGWGADLTPAAIFLSSAFPATCATVPTTCQFNSTNQTKALFTGGGQFDVYVATAEAAYAVPVSCSGASGPSATVSGSRTLCSGSSASIQASLTGTPPWSLTWSDGAVQSGILSSPASRTVSPSTTTTYTVTAVSDATGPGVSSGSATLTVTAAPATPVVTAPATVLPGSTLNDASVVFHTGSTYLWTIGNGLVTTGQGTSQITFNAGSSGSVSLSVVETSSVGCASSPGTASSAIDAPPAATGFYTLAPCRLFDTRNATGADAASPALAAGETRLLSVASRCGVPAAARSISVNVTTTDAAADGALTLYRGDLGSSPVASQNSFLTGTTRAAMAFVELARDGRGTLNVKNGAPGSVHLVLDVNGFFQ